MEERRIGQTDAAQKRLELKAEDEAWYKQVAANPRLGYDENNNPIPPPSQRAPAPEAIPTTPDAPQGVLGPRISNEDADPGINYGNIADALNGGMKHLNEEGRAGGEAAVAGGAGALKPETAKEVFDIVDPERKLSEGKRILASIDATREFYLTTYPGKDGVERSNAAAAQWIQYARGMAAVQATAAQALLAKGDVPGAARALVEAANVIPDGNTTTYDEKANTFVTVDNEDGKVLQEGEVTPETIEKYAAGFAKGPAAYELILQQAMKSKDFNPGTGKKPAKEAKPVTSKELDETDPLADAEADKELNDNIGAELLTIVSGELKDIDGVPIFKNMEEFIAQVGEDSTNALSDLGVMIAKNNKGISVKEAAKLALAITNPDDKVGAIEDQQFDFEVLPVSKANLEAGIDVLELSIGGKTIRLPASQATDAIKTANRGLFIVMQETTQSKVNMTNERVKAGNEAAQADMAEQKRLDDERHEGVRTGRGSIVWPNPNKPNKPNLNPPRYPDKRVIPGDPVVKGKGRGLGGY